MTSFQSLTALLLVTLCAVTVHSRGGLRVQKWTDEELAGKKEVQANEENINDVLGEEVGELAGDGAHRSDAEEAIWMLLKNADAKDVDEKLLREKTIIEAKAATVFGKANIRSKRMVMNSPSRKWDQGIVPYDATTNDIPEWIQEAIHKAMNMLERFSCFRFVPWSKTDGVTTNTQMGLSHQGYIKFVNEATCWATQGNVKNDNGQKISCCGGLTCVHEMGHALGAYHENQNPKGKGIIRQNSDNVIDGYQSAFELKDGFSTGYDIQSVMHYSSHSWTTGGETITKLWDGLKGLGGSEYYYLTQELSLSHNCGGVYCGDSENGCENDGYSTLIDNRCQCRCPAGLNPLTNCTTVLGSEWDSCINVNGEEQCAQDVADGLCAKKWSYMNKNCRKACGWCDRFDRYDAFPPGQYALPAVASGCPSGFPDFKTGSAEHQLSEEICANVKTNRVCNFWKNDGWCWKNVKLMEKNCPVTCNNCGLNQPTSGRYQLGGAVSKAKVQHKFCVNDGSTKAHKNAKKYGHFKDIKWPVGSYCLYKYGDSCPDGFKSGSITFRHASTTDGTVPSGAALTDGRTMLEYCCRDDGFSADELNMPSKEAFALFSYGNGQCQKVRGTFASEEYTEVVIDNAAADITGTTPSKMILEGAKLYRIYHCYYAPVNTDCGGVIELSADKPTVSFSSPEGNYRMCNWFFKGPKGSQILLNFDNFNIKGGDSVGIRSNRLGQLPIRYYGVNFDSSVTTVYNTLALNYDSKASSTSAFSAKVTLLHEGNMCYNTADKGRTYNGNHAFTKRFKRCLPWNEVQHCKHHALNAGDKDGNLNENYCRNPNPEDGLQPWCYYESSGCKRDYCDVCGVENVYDIDEDCASGACGGYGSDKLSKCAKTCNGNNVEATATTCGPPPALGDGAVLDAKDSYTVGEQATYTCNDNPSSAQRYCLSNGEWSVLSEVCDNCERGWSHFNRKCYKLFEEQTEFKAAKTKCKNNSNSKVTNALSAEENAFVRTLIHDTTWLSLSDWQKEGTYKWMSASGKVLDWSNWISGQPNNYGNADNTIMLKSNGKWKDVNGSNGSNFHAVVCMTNALDNSNPQCGDSAGNCVFVKAAVTDACSKGYMTQYCKGTCGKC